MPIESFGYSPYGLEPFSAGSATDNVRSFQGNVVPSALPAIPFPTLVPNWDQEVTVTTEFLAIAREAVNPHEERVLQLERPKRSIRYQSLARTRGEQQDVLIAPLRNSTEQPFIPLWSDARPLETSVAPLDSEVFFDTLLCRIFPGQRALLFDRGAVAFCEVSSIYNDHIVLTSAAGGSFPAATSFVVPLFEAEKAFSGTLQVITDAHSGIAHEYSEVVGPSMMPPISAVGSPLYEYFNGSPIYNPRIDYSEEPIVTLRMPGNVSLAGKGSYKSPRADIPFFDFDFSLGAMTRQDAFGILSFFESCRGSIYPFWFPNPHTVWVLEGIDSSYVDVTGHSPESVLQDYFTHVAIELKDHRIVMAEIASISAQGQNSRITFSSPITAPDPSDIHRVTSGHHCRWASDSLTETWANTEVCIMRNSLRGVFESEDISTG